MSLVDRSEFVMVNRTWLGAVVELGFLALLVATIGTFCVVLPNVHHDWVSAPVGDDPDVPTGRSLDWWTAKSEIIPD